MSQYMLFTCAPGFEMISAHDTVAEALDQARDEANNAKGDYLGIIPITWLVLTETLAGPNVIQGKYAEALQVLDLRPSELEALAKEIAETSEPGDHTLIQAIREAYEANKGEEMPCPYEHGIPLTPKGAVNNWKHQGTADKLRELANAEIGASTLFARELYKNIHTSAKQAVGSNKWIAVRAVDDEHIRVWKTAEP